MKSLIPILRQIIESSIDFPSNGLYNEVWTETEDGYKLRPELKEQVLAALREYPDLDLLDIAKEIHIVGSIGTNLYNDDADLDIHILPDMEKLPTKDIDELTELQKQVMDWFKNNRDERGWYVAGTHPYEVYLQLDPQQDYSSNCYDLLTDTWITEPILYPLNYNPYEVFGQVFDELKELCKPFDIQFGELRRDTIDYTRLMDAIKKAPEEAKQGLKVTLEQKLQELEEDIEQLVQNREVWRNVRRRNTVTTQLAQDIKELQQSPEWQNDNAIFKFIDRYEMMNVLKGLKDIIDDGEVTDDEVPEIQDLIKQFGEI